MLRPLFSRQAPCSVALCRAAAAAVVLVVMHVGDAEATVPLHHGMSEVRVLYNCVYFCFIQYVFSHIICFLLHCIALMVTVSSLILSISDFTYSFVFRIKETAQRRKYSLKKSSRKHQNSKIEIKFVHC